MFEQLYSHRIHLEGMILKPNMVISGKKAASRANPQQVAEATVRTLKRYVPGAVPGIAFLSGGQSSAEATEHLSLMNKLGSLPWELTLLVRPRVAGRGAEGVGRQAGDVRCRPEGVLPPREVQRPGAQRQLQLEAGTGSGLKPLRSDRAIGSLNVVECSEQKT